jgi:colicin import membrane protein
MAGKTLYDVLELSSSASAESIRAAYERLSGKLDPSRPENANRQDLKLLSDAIKEAFLTLSNPTARAQYDRKLAMRTQQVAAQITEVYEPFWTIPKLAALVLVVIIAAGFYYKNKREENRLAAERAIATAKAKEAEEQAKLEAEQARLDFARQQQDRMQEEQQRRERDAALLQFSSDQRGNAIGDQRANQLRTQQERTADLQRQREEQQATAAARAQAAKEKTELCRMERQRYGKAISC